MRFWIIAPLALAACAIPCPQDRVICDPETKTCICERPTGTLAAAMRGEGTDRTARPAVDRPEPPRDHVTEPKPDVEPDRQTDPDGWQKWRDSHPRGGNGENHAAAGKPDGKGAGGEKEHGDRDKSERGGEHGEKEGRR